MTFSILKILSNLSLNSLQYHFFLKWLQMNYPQMFHSLLPFFERKQLLLNFMSIKLYIKSRSKVLVHGGMVLLLLRKLFCKIQQNHQIHPVFMLRIMSRLFKVPKLSNATCVATLIKHSCIVSSAAFHPTAPLLATGSFDHTAKLWSFSPDGSVETCVATLKGHSNCVLSVAFHPTAPLLATGSEDNTAKFWRFSPDGSAATCVATLAGHSDWVYSVAFHPTAPLLATGSADKTAKLWLLSPDGSAATCVATLAGKRELVYSVAFHQTAPLLATSFGDGTAKLYH